MSRLYFDIVMAASRSGGIGLKGKLPWHLPEDMKFFKKLTSSTLNPAATNAVVMGRKTWESLRSIGGLANRLNIIISRTMRESAELKRLNAKVFPSLDACLAHLSASSQPKIEKVFVIGGSQLFQEAIQHPSCRDFFLTQLGVDLKCDTYLPKGYGDKFVCVECSKTYAHKMIPFAFQRFVHKQHHRADQP